MSLSLTEGYSSSCAITTATTNSSLKEPWQVIAVPKFKSCKKKKKNKRKYFHQLPCAWRVFLLHLHQPRCVSNPGSLTVPDHIQHPCKNSFTPSAMGRAPSHTLGGFLMLSPPMVSPHPQLPPGRPSSPGCASRTLQEGPGPAAPTPHHATHGWAGDCSEWQ